MNSPILWYFADPMCSWCWGFSPVIEALRERYGARLRVALVLGGLRPGERAALSAAAREDILHHWHAVAERTGQPFRFDGALAPGFVYDTEPASRAVVAVGALAPGQIFAMFKAIQHAFYAEGRDVTQPDVLAALAAGCGIDTPRFQPAFDSDDARAKTRAHFRQARAAGVHGFPALILQQDDRLTRVGEGCQPRETVERAIDACLSA
ncbi:conserved hypothetical protein [Thiobacillus denitrificans ATCC 25259]|uniref:DSBA-like thioredoxin domain-containing protein n=1 Tax=Thiobacillus denitrificans (strain ATCC 25259 / T1) TaxID=292415 RepID=Q3SH90_THIDA|nr:DsbA family protein [Thiobacillus denitrificans]AAZ97999.1 conserved hypothetical protein [Thiobacillus denitrificans ATCC 25259]